MQKEMLTHRVAVIAYIVRGDKFLLLKRNQPPKIWAPPGGHLHFQESPVEGIIREIKEETNLDVEVVAPVTTWFGEWNGYRLLSIDYLVRVIGGSLQLSAEHSDAAWVSLEELKKGQPIRLDPRLGFTLEDFEKAERLIRCLRNNG
ncbi:MAG: hypothetical protein Kow0037_06350 [Calditrichia bacterium]